MNSSNGYMIDCSRCITINSSSRWMIINNRWMTIYIRWMNSNNKCRYRINIREVLINNSLDNSYKVRNKK